MTMIGITCVDMPSRDVALVPVPHAQAPLAINTPTTAVLVNLRATPAHYPGTSRQRLFNDRYDTGRRSAGADQTQREARDGQAGGREPAKRFRNPPAG
jgi:hypothetical protein